MQKKTERVETNKLCVTKRDPRSDSVCNLHYYQFLLLNAKRQTHSLSKKKDKLTHEIQTLFNNVRVFFRETFFHVAFSKLISTLLIQCFSQLPSQLSTYISISFHHFLPPPHTQFPLLILQFLNLRLVSGTYI